MCFLVLSASIIVKSNLNVSTHFRNKHMRARGIFLTLLAIWSNLVHRYSWVLRERNWIGLCGRRVCTYSIGKHFHLSSRKTIKPAKANMLAHRSHPQWLWAIAKYLHFYITVQFQNKRAVIVFTESLYVIILLDCNTLDLLRSWHWKTTDLLFIGTLTTTQYDAS